MNMDPIQPNTLQPPKAAPAANAARAESGENRTALTSDYEMFLQMLTTQMTNQDPLNPVDSSDYAVQLATFSSVEQQVLTNDLLTELTSKLGSSGLADMAGYVGNEVRTTAPAFFDGTPIDLTPDIAIGADAAKLSVRNANGDVVQEFELDPAGGSIAWAGVDGNGRPLPSGLYEFEVTSYSGEEILEEAPASSYARILEAQKAGDDLELILAGGVTVTPADVTAMRR
jgi:flagellar basal-body rod modification protein FlgD